MEGWRAGRRDQTPRPARYIAHSHPRVNYIFPALDGAVSRDTMTPRWDVTVRMQMLLLGTTETEYSAK